MRCLPVSLCLLGAFAVSGCDRGLDDPAPLGVLDEPYFRCRVQPVLTKSCSTFRCHGDGKRFFKLFARNRLRFGLSEDERNLSLQDIERRYNFNASLAQVDFDEPLQSMFLLKPLDEKAGGYFHGGAEEYGMGDVFLSRDEPDFATLQSWVTGATEDPGCIEPGSNL